MDALLQPLGEALAYGFVQRGLLALILAGGLCALIGCFVVARGLAFFSDALSHAVLPGVAIAWVSGGGAMGSNLFIGGLGAGVLAALVIALLGSERKLREDTTIGIVSVTMFALGIAILGARPGSSVDLEHILFGSLGSISDGDLATMALAGTAVTLVTSLCYKQLLIVSFDPDHARALNLPAVRLRALLLVLVAVTIVVSLQAVGIALMLALLLTPAATARLLTQRFSAMLPLAALTGCAGGLVGFAFSWALNIPPGASIVLCLSAFFALVYCARALAQGLLRKG